MSLMGGSTAAASKFSLKSLAMASDFEFLPEGERVFKKAFDQRMNNEQLVSLPSLLQFSLSWTLVIILAMLFLLPL